MTVERVRSLAKERGISLTFICKKIGVASPYFIDLEKSNREIPDSKLEQIAEVLFTTPAYLRGETDDPAMINDSIEAEFAGMELPEILDALKNRDEMRMLFSLTKDATKEDVLQAVKIIEALKK